MLYRISFCILLIINLVACGPREIIIGGIKTNSSECKENFKYVKAHKKNEDAIFDFVRGRGGLPNKPSELINLSAGVCGAAANDALNEYIRVISDAESERAMSLSKIERDARYEKMRIAEESYKEQLAILEKNAS